MPLYARILKSEIKKKASDISYVELLEKNIKLKKDLEEELKDKLKIWLEKEWKNWEYDEDVDYDDEGFKYPVFNGPSAENELSKFLENVKDDGYFNNFINNLLKKEGIDDKVDDDKVNEFTGHIYDKFDSLYDIIEDEIEEVRENYKDGE